MLASACCAVADLPVTARIVNGTAVTSIHTPVVQVRRAAASGYYLCTGSILTSKVILTASHCVVRSVGRMNPVSPKIMRVVIAGRSFAVKRIKVHPAAMLQQSSGLIQNDVALLFLEKATSIRRLSLLVSRAPQPDDRVRVLGYGLDRAPYGTSGVLRSGYSIINSVDSDFVVTVYRYLYEANSCSGDSGGPAVLSYIDSNGITRAGIVGTVSTGTTQNCVPGDLTYYVNTQSPAVLDFITSNTRFLKLQ